VAMSRIPSKVEEPKLPWQSYGYRYWSFMSGVASFSQLEARFGTAFNTRVRV
jgi:hypothetical protein